MKITITEDRCFNTSIQWNEGDDKGKITLDMDEFKVVEILRMMPFEVQAAILKTSFSAVHAYVKKTTKTNRNKIRKLLSMPWRHRETGDLVGNYLLELQINNTLTIRDVVNKLSTRKVFTPQEFDAIYDFFNGPKTEFYLS
jgi:hypothetical protein